MRASDEMRASAHPTLLLRLTWLDVDVVAKATSDVLVFTRASALYVGVEEAQQHASVGLHQDSDREQGCIFFLEIPSTGSPALARSSAAVNFRTSLLTTLFAVACCSGQQTSAKSFFSPRLAPSRRDGGGRAQATSQCVALRLPCKRESCYTPLLGRVAASVGEDAHGRANARLHERNDKRVPANPFATAPVPALLFAGLSARG